MLLKHLIPGLACVAILAGCASDDLARPKSVQSLAAAIEEADAALKAGQADQAITLYKAAATAYPADKAVWLRLAQLRFDSAHYGQAIVDAGEVLERDDDDMVAHSIAAVSGLRVASRALADLSQKNNLTGTVRTEAQDLAKLLRTALGEQTLVPGPAVRPSARRRDHHPVVAPSLPSLPQKQASGNNPFESFAPKK